MILVDLQWIAVFREKNQQRHYTLYIQRMADVVENFRLVEEKIREAPARFGISPRTLPKIIAVSKGHGLEKILPLLEHGHRIFGESRVQEAYAKWPALKEKYPDVELHLIGPLQTNKVKEALRLFDMIQTLDREKLALTIASAPEKIDLLIQVNTGEEPQKAGVTPTSADRFIKSCRDDLHLPVKGLMCIPPVDAPPGLHFGLLRKIAERNGLKVLSMGMSGDFETAIALGATHIRIGTAIFGERSIAP